MITLITGGPGTGKTAWLLDQLLTIRLVDPNREFYIHGVRNLRGIAHETIYCKSQLCDICRANDQPENAKFVENWNEWKPVGALIIVDEVQRIWRPRAGAAAPPAAVSGLETHRHYGLDFWLISQGPHLFDNFIRLLVGRHVHLVSRWNGRTQYEWPECKQDVQSRADAVIRPYSLPKRVYSMYDSAELHTKQDKRKPLSFYATIAAVLIAAIMIVVVVQRLRAKINPEVIQETSVVVKTPGVLNQSISSPGQPVQSHRQQFPDYTPTVSGVPESAPAYAHLLKVSAIPHLMGCVSTPDFCKCYTVQGTPYPTSKAFCGEYVKGHYFNPYKSKNVLPDQESQTMAKNEVVE